MDNATLRKIGRKPPHRLLRYRRPTGQRWPIAAKVATGLSAWPQFMSPFGNGAARTKLTDRRPRQQLPLVVREDRAAERAEMRAARARNLKSSGRIAVGAQRRPMVPTSGQFVAPSFPALNRNSAFSKRQARSSAISTTTGQEHRHPADNRLRRTRFEPLLSFGGAGRVTSKRLLEMGISEKLLREVPVSNSRDEVLKRAEFIATVKDAVLLELRSLLEESR
jgi:hypothetical protein